MQSTVAVVTGGSRGIGRAIVERLAVRGHHVLFTFVSDPAAAAELERASGERGLRVTSLRCDIADPDAPERIVRRAAEIGDYRILVNNAGVTGRLGTLATLRDEDLDRVLAVNVTGVIRLARSTVRAWTGLEGPRSIVQVSSLASVTGSPGEYTWYAASKAAVDAFTVGLAKEVAAHGIRVNSVRAGTTRTGIHAAAGDPDRPDRLATTHPARRVAEPDEIAAAVDWLVSAEASYVSGALLPVTGGIG